MTRATRFSNRSWQWAALLLAVQFTFAGLVAARQAKEVDEPTEKQIQICSILGVPLANAEAWVQGDVLIEVIDTFDNVSIDDPNGPIGAAYSRKEMRRFVFDFDSGNFLQAMVGNLDGVYLPKNKDAKDMTEVQLEAKFGSHENKKVWSLSNDSRLASQSGAATDMLQFLSKLRLVDIRSIWTNPHSGRFFSSKITFAMNTRWWEQCKSARGFQSNNESKSEITLVFDSIFDGHIMSKKITIDANTQMPTEVKQTGKNIKTGRVFGGRSATIKWEFKNNIYLPISIQTKRGAFVRIDGVEEGGMLYQDVKLHWFSINEKVDTKLFSKENIQSKEAVYKLLDPVLTGADTLVDKKNKSSNSNNAKAGEKKDAYKSDSSGK